MIKEAYVSCETAKLLKEKGFDKPCRAYYDMGGLKEDVTFPNDWSHSSFLDHISAPTHQMTMAWLREEHNICITIYPDKKHKWEAVLYNIEDDVEITLQSFGIFGRHIYAESYSDAIEEALKYCLTNLI